MVLSPCELAAIPAAILLFALCLKRRTGLSRATLMTAAVLLGLLACIRYRHGEWLFVGFPIHLLLVRQDGGVVVDLGALLLPMFAYSVSALLLVPFGRRLISRRAGPPRAP